MTLKYNQFIKNIYLIKSFENKILHDQLMLLKIILFLIIDKNIY